MSLSSVSLCQIILFSMLKRHDIRCMEVATVFAYFRFIPHCFIENNIESLFCLEQILYTSNASEQVGGLVRQVDGL